MKNYRVQILHHIALSTEIEAENQEQALQMAGILSDEIKPVENYSSSELSVNEIET